LNSSQCQCNKQHKPLFSTFEQCGDHQGVPGKTGFDVDACKFELSISNNPNSMILFIQSAVPVHSAKFKIKLHTSRRLLEICDIIPENLVK
jgi:hypothetical protein